MKDNILSKSSKYCSVEYKEDYNVVFVEWKRFCCYEDYREPLEFALEIINVKK